MFFNNLKKNQTAANVDQQSTPESTVCVELSDEELCAVNGGSVTYILIAGILVKHVLVAGVWIAVHH